MSKIINFGKVLSDPPMPEKVKNMWFNGKCILTVCGKAYDMSNNANGVSDKDYLCNADYVAIPMSHMGEPIEDSLDLYYKITELPLSKYTSKYTEKRLDEASEEVQGAFTFEKYLKEFEPELRYLLDALCYEYSLGFVCAGSKTHRIVIVKLKDFSTKLPAFSYELVYGPNTKQWWVYNNDADCFIDPPSDVLSEVKKAESYEKEEEVFGSLVAKNPDWLYEKDYWYEDVEP